MLKNEWEALTDGVFSGFGFGCYRRTLMKGHLWILLLALNACTSAPVAVPTPAPSASATALPSPSPSPDLPRPTAPPGLSGPQVKAVVLPTSTLSFQLTFTEAMDPDSVRESVSIHLLQDARLSWQSGAQGVFEALIGQPIHADIPIEERPLIMTGKDFDINWNSDETEFTLGVRATVLSEAATLVTDKNPQFAPRYALSFCAQGKKQTLQGRQGDVRRAGWFQSTENPDFVPFQITPPSTPPHLRGVGIEPQGLILEFGTPIGQATPWGAVSSANPALNPDLASRVTNPAHYRVRVYRGSFQGQIDADYLWAQVSGSSAVLAAGFGTEPLYRLYLRADKPLFSNQSYVEVEVVGDVKDVWGNSLKGLTFRQHPMLIDPNPLIVEAPR